MPYSSPHRLKAAAKRGLHIGLACAPYDTIPLMILKLKSQFAPIITHPLLQQPAVRIGFAIAYTALLTLVLIQSSAHPVVGPVAPRDFNLAWEIFLTAGHLIGFTVLVIALYSALTTAAPPLRALIVAVVFACALGLLSEYIQSFVPDRSASLFDLACDWGMAFCAAYQIRRRW